MVRPIDLELYQRAWRETKAYTFPGYLKQVADLLDDGSTESRIQNVTRGIIRNWKILNAIRVIVGLKVVKINNGPSEAEVASLMKLDKSA